MNFFGSEKTENTVVVCLGSEKGRSNMAGKLYGIGVGPGDPELITVKALRLMRECQVIAVPGKGIDESVAFNIAKGVYPEITDKEVVHVPTPMSKELQVLQARYKQVATQLEKLLDQDKDIALLTLGDPTVYSTAIYIHRLVSADGYETEIINGIPSFCAASAKLGDSLVDRDMELHIVPASYQIEDALKVSGTKVLMKFGSKLSKVKAELMDKGCRAVMIENCGMEGEAVYTEVENFPETGSYYSIIIVKPEYKAVVFDMDGVIFDSERAVLECWLSLAQKYNIENIEGNFLACTGTTMKQTRQIMMQAYGPDFPYDQYAKEASIMYHQRYDGGRLPLKEGIRELLDYLKAHNKKLAVASSTRKEVVVSQLEAAGLLDYFDFIVGGEMVENSKPDPEIYIMACKLLQVSPEEAYAIEDSHNGIRSAHAAGMMPIMVPDLLSPNEEMRQKAVAVCDSLTHVIKYLSK